MLKKYTAEILAKISSSCHAGRVRRLFYSIFLFFLTNILLLSVLATNNQSFAYIGQACNIYNENPGNGCSNPATEICNLATAESPSGNSTCVATTAGGDPSFANPGEPCDINGPGAYIFCANPSHVTCDQPLGAAQGVCRIKCTVTRGGPAKGTCQSNEVCKPNNTNFRVLDYDGNPPPSSWGPVPGNARLGFTQAYLNQSTTGICVPETSQYGTIGMLCTGTGQGSCLPGNTCTHPKTTESNNASCLPNDSNNYSCIREADKRGSRTYLECPVDMGCGYNLFKGCQDPDGINRPEFECHKCHFTRDVEFKCKCDTHGGFGSEKNGFKCNNAVGETARGFCQDSPDACFDVTTGDDLPTPMHVLNMQNAPERYDDPSCGDVCEWAVDIGEAISGFFGAQKNSYRANLFNIQCSGVDPRNTEFVQPNVAPCEKKNADGTCAQILTAFGPVSTDPVGFISSLFGILLGTAGMIAVLLIMRAGYRIMTARGNPEGIKEGREQIVAAIVGLMFLIFSFVLLQVIGVDLLRLPTDPGSVGSGAGTVGTGTGAGAGTP